MRSRYKNKDLLKNHPFDSSELKTVEKRTKTLVISVFYLNHHFFLEKSKELTNIELIIKRASISTKKRKKT